MPEFVNPFVGDVPDRKLTREELIRALRLDIAAEHEAAFLYTAHAEAIDDPVARAVLLDVANEEIVHIGEFERVLEMISPRETELRRDGVAEVDEMAAALSGGEPEDGGDDGAPPAATVGSLRPGDREEGDDDDS
ncbi:MAG TPA: Rubrerythrin [Thermoleophilia bacterium]|nr:Rubrerythrin [Thermoleophilia bacterium]